MGYCHRPRMPHTSRLTAKLSIFFCATSRDHAGRRAPRRYLQQHVLDGLDERFRRITRRHTACGRPSSCVPEDRCQGQAVTLAHQLVGACKRQRDTRVCGAQNWRLFPVVILAVSINFFIPRLRSTNPIEAYERVRRPGRGQCGKHQADDCHL